MYGPSPLLENRIFVPRLFARSRADNTRVAQTNLDGAVYYLNHDCLINTIVGRISARTGAPTLSVQIFQSATPVLSVTSVPRVASVSDYAVPAANTNFEAPLDGGDLFLKAGFLWILWGQDSASDTFTLVSYTIQSMTLINQSVPNDQIPLAFSTSLAANTNQASIDPTEGGDADGSTGNTAGLFLFKKS